MASKNLKTAVAYIRTSSETNVGADKDSAKRQLSAIKAFAKSAGYEIIEIYSDEGVKGADPIDQRPGFSAALSHIARNGVRTIICETASRFARDLITQETGWNMLREAGVTLIAADSPEAFLDDGPTATLIRQILGSVSEFEKAMLVAKLKGARDRKRKLTGKCGGRKSYVERDAAMVTLAKRLHKRDKSLREIASELEAAGYVNARGNRLQAAAVARMIAA